MPEPAPPAPAGRHRRQGRAPSGPAAEALLATPPAARWAIAIGCAAAGVLVPGLWLACVVALELALFLSTTGMRATVKDARPLLWHAPILLIGMLLLRGQIDWLKALEISARFMTTTTPIFWLQRMTTPTELLKAFSRLLPLRLRLLLLFAVRLWPLLLRDLRDIALIQRLRGGWPKRLRDWRPRHAKRAADEVLTPIGVRAVRLTDDLAASLEARGLDDL